MAEIQVDVIQQDDISKIWGGDGTSVIIPDDKKSDEEKQEDFKNIGLDTNFAWDDFKKEGSEKSDTENTDDKKVEDEKTTTDSKEDDTNKDKKETKTDLISTINSLVEEGILTGFDDGDIKSLDEAKDLIKLNIESIKNSSKEDLKKEIIESYSPQIQAIIQYAENGGTDIAPLLTAISKVEEATQYDLTTEDGQIQAVVDYLTHEGLSKKDIKEEIDILKDVNKLESKSTFYAAKMQKMKQDELQEVLENQERLKEQQKEARDNYLATIKTTLEKDLIGEMKLAKADKAALWDSLTNIKYTTWNGQPTNGFFKKLEEIQAGQKADYDHFMEIVYLTVNREKFKEKIREEIRTEESARIHRKLKIQENKGSSVTDTVSSQSKKISKDQGFKNPWL